MGGKGSGHCKKGSGSNDKSVPNITNKNSDSTRKSKSSSRKNGRAPKRSKTAPESPPSQILPTVLSSVFDDYDSDEDTDFDPNAHQHSDDELSDTSMDDEPEEAVQPIENRIIRRMNAQTTEAKITVAFNDTIKQFISKKYLIVDKPNEIQSVVPPMEQPTRLNEEYFTDNGFSYSSPFAIFDAVSREVLLSVVSSMNSNLMNLYDEAPKKTKRRWKQTSLEEVQMLCGYFFRLEGMRSPDEHKMNENVRKISKSIDNGGFAKIDSNRFDALKQALELHKDQMQNIVKIMNRVFPSMIIPGTTGESDHFTVAFDESIWALYVLLLIRELFWNTQNQIPVVYIPRKPHKNGLLSYLSVMMLTGVPYVLYVSPFIEHPKETPCEEFNNCRSHLNQVFSDIKIHYTADSAFCGEDMFTDEDYVTVAFSENQSSYVWSVLEKDSRQDSHTAAWNIDKRLFATSFANPEGQEQSAESLEDECKKKRFRVVTNAYEPTTIPSVANQTSTIDVPNQQSNWTEQQRRTYTGEYLAELRAKQLLEICEKNHLSKTYKLKSDIVDRILKALHPDPQVERAVFETAKRLNSRAPGRSKVHNHYKDTFNYVDLVNAKWYRYAFAYAQKDWKRKMTISLLDLLMINAHALYNSKTPMQYDAFRKEVIRELLKRPIPKNKGGRPKSS